MRQRSASGLSGTWRFDGFDLSLLCGLSAERSEWEQTLLGSRRALPLPHRSAWAAFQPSADDNWLMTVSDAAGRPCGAAALHVAPSRALPGHLLLRCERFGPGIAPEAQRAVLQALVSLARERRRVLRLSIEFFAIDASQRAALERHAQTLGFSQVIPMRSYEHTLVMSLEGDEQAIFASIHRNARQNVRAVEKNPVQVRPVNDPAYFPRLDQISRETYARTGGAYHPTDWGTVVALSAAEPSVSRLVGLYRTDVSGPASLLAFAWGCGHGDHAHYSRSASTRDTDLRLPLLYPVLWDLICWAKRNGARYFDLGGVTVGSLHSADPLGGISDFKRAFSKRIEQVGAEWAFEPRPIRAHAARVVSSASSYVARMLARSRPPADRTVRRAPATAAPAAIISPRAPADLVARGGEV
jgi:hypothetical protein